MSPKSILQFLAVCGIAQVAEAFATLSKPAANDDVTIGTEFIDTQGISFACPCFSEQKCIFGGSANVPTVGDLDWRGEYIEFVGWIDDCYNSCYKDPDTSKDGSAATYWQLCGGKRVAAPWTKAACDDQWALRKEPDSFVFDDGSNYSKQICPPESEADVTADAKKRMCELIAYNKPKRIPPGNGCQMAMNYLYTELMGMHPPEKTCNQLWGYENLPGTGNVAYTCRYFVKNEGKPNEKKKCVRDPNNGIQVQGNIGWDVADNGFTVDRSQPFPDPNDDTVGCRLCPDKPGYKKGKGAFNCEENRRLPYYPFVSGGDVYKAVNQTNYAASNLSPPFPLG